MTYSTDDNWFNLDSAFSFLVRSEISFNLCISVFSFALFSSSSSISFAFVSNERFNLVISPSYQYKEFIGGRIEGKRRDEGIYVSPGYN